MQAGGGQGREGMGGLEYGGERAGGGEGCWPAEDMTR